MPVYCVNLYRIKHFPELYHRFSNAFNHKFSFLENSRWPATFVGTDLAFRNLLPARISVRVVGFSLRMLKFTLFCKRRHLIGTGRTEEARGVIAALNGVPDEDGLVDELVDELQYAIDAENEGGKATWMECFSTRNHMWKRTVNGMMLQFIQQLNGQNFYCELLKVGSLKLTRCSLTRNAIQTIMETHFSKAPVPSKSYTLHNSCVS